MKRDPAWAVAGLLVMASPVLVVPQVVGPGLAPVAATVGVIALAVGVVVLAPFGRVAWCAGLLAVAAVVGWWRAGVPADALEHFNGLALGLLTMATVATWARTRRRFEVAALCVIIAGVVALTVGFRSVLTPHQKVLLSEPAAPGTGSAQPPMPPSLPLGGLHAERSVNPNALAATAMLILPVAAAVAWMPAQSAPLGQALRAAGWLASAWAVALVVLMQSRSAWLAAIVVAWLLARRWVSARLWWGLGVTGFVVLPVLVVTFGRAIPQVAFAWSSLSGRTEIWRGAVEALALSPWFGIGFDQFRHTDFAPLYYTVGRYTQAVNAHHFFLQTALDVGLVGLAAYLAMIAGILRRAVEVLRGGGDPWVRSVAVGAALAVVSVHVYGLADTVSLGAKVGIFQWLSCGLILAAWRMQAPTEGT